MTQFIVKCAVLVETAIIPPRVDAAGSSNKYWMCINVSKFLKYTTLVGNVCPNALILL